MADKYSTRGYSRRYNHGSRSMRFELIDSQGGNSTFRLAVPNLDSGMLPVSYTKLNPLCAMGDS